MNKDTKALRQKYGKAAPRKGRRGTCKPCQTAATTDCTPAHGETVTYRGHGNINEKVERVVRGWSQWSPAERRGMDRIVEEVLDHMRNGTGNTFIRNFVERVVMKDPACAAAMRS